MAYAEISDIESRWRDLTSDEEAQATVFLDDASAMLSKLVDVDADDTEQAYLLKMVCADMVIRKMSASSDAVGVDQSSITAGPYSQTYHFANPTGAMYVTKAEKHLLGISTGYIGVIPVRTAYDD